MSNLAQATDLPLAGLAILLIEDHALLAQSWKRALVRHGAEVVIAETIAAAKYALSKRTFSGWIVDRELPDGDGFEEFILRRDNDETPIFRVAASGHFDAESQLQVQRAGAVVIDKTYLRGSAELVGAVQLARQRAGLCTDEAILIGAYRFDPRQATLHGPNGLIALGSGETGVLAYLVKNADRWSTTQEIAEAALKRSDAHGRDLVWQYITRLRKAFGSEEGRIRSIRGKGFSKRSRDR